MEQWKPVIGWEGTYEVSNTGVVRNAKTHHRLGQNPRKGYLRVVLQLEGKPRYRTVHSLVCEAFHGPRRGGLEVRHLDGDRTNNVASNLRWGTRAENVADSVRHGTRAWSPERKAALSARMKELHALRRGQRA